MHHKLLVAFACAFAVAAAAPQADLITSLPNYPGPFLSKQYSGYLAISDTINIHYYFVESEGDPANDPLVLWLNGGPGCSSLDGAFSELGPLRFSPADPKPNDTITVVNNPWRWNKIANVLFLEAPVGVGFSYSTNPSVDYKTNDNITAANNYQAVMKFLSEFPEYQNHDLYLSGESYAGIYVPTLADQFLMNGGANLKGIAVGNGCIGNSVGACSAKGNQIRSDFLFGHALFSQDLKAKLDKACPDMAHPDAECDELMKEQGRQVAGINIYNVIGPCINGDGVSREHQITRIPKHPGMTVGGPVECINGLASGKYLNMPSVREAMHVKPESEIGHWTVCTDKIQYDSNTVSLLPLYPSLIAKYRVLIYNGDADACVPYNGNEQWTSFVGGTPSKPWHAWTVNEQVAGYATIYSDNFSFVTVRAAGHMVPQFQPERAFAMISKFLNNEPF